MVSTALGVALGGRPVVAQVGDNAFVHDSGALTALRRRRADLRVVVVDNDGGGIFSFLPQATALEGERFEQLFGTPHGLDLVALAAAYGVSARRLDPGADAAGNGTWAVSVRCAEIDGAAARVWAGNGIVADSDPATELAETRAKLQALLSALVRP